MSSHLVAGLRVRIRRRNHSECGLTIIELLVSLSLLILIAGSLAGGLQIFRRAFDTDRRAQVAAEAEQAIDIVASQIAAAFPFADARSGRLAFDGRPNTISFTRLDQGRANRAGLQHALIQQAGDDLTMTLTSAVQGQNAASSEPLSPIVLLNRVSQVQFSYFGTVGQSTGPVWRADWSAMERLPELISIQVGFKDPTTPGATVLVALRQH
jgi:type II secretory pathway pseudopilin PulG